MNDLNFKRNNGNLVEIIPAFPKHQGPNSNSQLVQFEGEDPQDGKHPGMPLHQTNKVSWVNYLGYVESDPLCFYKDQPAGNPLALWIEIKNDTKRNLFIKDMQVKGFNDWIYTEFGNLATFKLGFSHYYPYFYVMREYTSYIHPASPEYAFRNLPIWKLKICVEKYREERTGKQRTKCHYNPRICMDPLFEFMSEWTRKITKNIVQNIDARARGQTPNVLPTEITEDMDVRLNPNANYAGSEEGYKAWVAFFQNTDYKYKQALAKFENFGVDINEMKPNERKAFQLMERKHDETRQLVNDLINKNAPVWNDERPTSPYGSQAPTQDRIPLINLNPAQQTPADAININQNTQQNANHQPPIQPPLPPAQYPTLPVHQPNTHTTAGGHVGPATTSGLSRTGITPHPTSQQNENTTAHNTHIGLFPPGIQAQQNKIDLEILKNGTSSQLLPKPKSAPSRTRLRSDIPPNEVIYDPRNGQNSGLSRTDLENMAEAAHRSTGNILHPNFVEEKITNDIENETESTSKGISKRNPKRRRVGATDDNDIETATPATESYIEGASSITSSFSNAERPSRPIRQKSMLAMESLVVDIKGQKRKKHRGRKSTKDTQSKDSQKGLDFQKHLEKMREKNANTQQRQNAFSFGRVGQPGNLGLFGKQKEHEIKNNKSLPDPVIDLTKPNETKEKISNPEIDPEGFVIPKTPKSNIELKQPAFAFGTEVNNLPTEKTSTPNRPNLRSGSVGSTNVKPVSDIKPKTPNNKRKSTPFKRSDTSNESSFTTELEKTLLDHTNRLTAHNVEEIGLIGDNYPEDSYAREITETEETSKIESTSQFEITSEKMSTENEENKEKTVTSPKN